ncbi:hypothetical protein D0812_07300 [Vibrio owensii]|uniref:Uncharacterized protein n=1 Tax=Vibrio owensii TaxID=696485 RepID=A0AAP9GAT6_9VIBR|nr:hypothetical protein [Vibrio owensii]AYO14223.1 hypothetical protein D0812_07300 [Vibrio owensii]QGH46888.1 hypothetical protein APZ19_07265 [Vibrio owensii]
MTTTVHDKNALTITSDSRWSVELDKAHVLFIDDTDFEKMVELPKFALVTAGDAILIEQWKNWAKGDISNPRPAVVRVDERQRNHYISVCLIMKPSIVLFDSQVATIVIPHARFSGSGREFAKCCWEGNQCARTAIETAKKSDVFTGGTVKYVELNTAANNLSADNATIQDLHTMLTTRGLVMNTNTGNTTPVQEHQEPKDIAKGLENGALVASAPTGDVQSPWNTTQEENLDAAIETLRKLVASA